MGLVHVDCFSISCYGNILSPNWFRTYTLDMQDAKEHIAALADKLGPSLTDIDVWWSQLYGQIYETKYFVF